MTTSEQSVDESLLDALDVQAVSIGLLQDYLSELRTLELQLQVEILNSSFHRGGILSTDPLLNDLVARVSRKIDEVMDALASRFEDDAVAMAVAEEERQRRVLFLLFGTEASPLSSAAGVALAPLAGVTIADAMRRLADDLKYRLAGSLRRGAAQGMTPAQLAELVLQGSPDAAAVMTSTVRGMEVLVVTQLSGVAAQARAGVVQNSLGALGQKINAGWIWVSVLDSRTSNICWSRAFKTWTVDGQPIGHSLPFFHPPAHPHCRSRTALTDLSSDAVPEFSFRQWADRQTAARLTRLFGAARTAQWTTGSLSDAELLRSRQGITLEEFRARSQSWNP